MSGQQQTRVAGGGGVSHQGASWGERFKRENIQEQAGRGKIKDRIIGGVIWLKICVSKDQFPCVCVQVFRVRVEL
jgi:hypothetical protein